MAFYDTRIREEELKRKIAEDWFGAFTTTRIIGNIDFAVDIPATELALGYAAEPALWAEAKAGVRKDIVESFVQLILTIGRARYADELPPLFLGAFDAEKIAFIPYNSVLDVLGKNDFNWNVTPSDHETKEFKELHELVSATIAREKMLFDFERDAAELRRFIRVNFRRGRTDVSKLRINKNNFTHIYRKWRDAVLPFIDAPWDMLKKEYGIYDRDFYLAEINVDDNDTSDISDDRPAAEFYITFRGNDAKPYRMTRKDRNGLESELPFGFKSGGLDAYAQFWSRYKRPPKKEYWSFIVKRLDLLVPQDVRERKGSFFTPKLWVEKSQQYLAKTLGENWQEDYYVWDCAGGTGNLEVGLTNKYNIFVSTLDQQDVDVIHQTLGDKGSQTLLDAHVFQFDFLNDDLNDTAKVPAALRDIIADADKRKKLVIYINPPYAEAGDAKQLSGHGKNKTDVAVSMRTYERYQDQIGIAGRELFAQFLIRIDQEMSGCRIGVFSTMKNLLGPNFKQFRTVFQPRLLDMFVVPADTFDNVKGRFPIAFTVWNTSERQMFSEIKADVYDQDGNLIGDKTIVSYDGLKTLTDWMIATRAKPSTLILGFNYSAANDIQHDNYNRLETTKEKLPSPRGTMATDGNVIETCVYLSIRHVIEASWLNDRDQFLFPNDGWSNDNEFQTDCLAYVLFAPCNNIQSQFGSNHWIPFTEAEVGAKERFASHFMTDFIRGAAGVRALPDGNSAVQPSTSNLQPLSFSPAAQAVFAAGRELWRYYHAQPGANPNASYYDIRAHFQGRKPNGTMNATSTDETYNNLLAALRAVHKALAAQIAPKVYEYGFLRK